MHTILTPEQSCLAPQWPGQPAAGYIAHNQHRDRRVPVYHMGMARLRVDTLNARHADDVAALVLLDARGRVARRKSEPKAS